MRIHGRKADGGLAQHWSPEIKSVDGWSEIVTLLGFRKHIRNIVALVAPGIHVNGSKEDSEPAMDNQPYARNGLGNADTWSKIVGVRVFESAGKSILPAYKDGRNTILENKI